MINLIFFSIVSDRSETFQSFSRLYMVVTGPRLHARETRGSSFRGSIVLEKRSFVEWYFGNELIDAWEITLLAKSSPKYTPNEHLCRCFKIELSPNLGYFDLVFFENNTI